MSEFNVTPRSDIDDYEAFVLESRFSDATKSGWVSTEQRVAYAGYIDEEAFEVLSQHGPAFNLLTPDTYMNIIYQNPSIGGIESIPELQAKIADEAGDMVWFLSDILLRQGHGVTQALEQRLSERAGQQLRINDFASLDQAVMEHANVIDRKHSWPQFGDRQPITEFPGQIYLTYNDTLRHALKDTSPDEDQAITNAAADLLLALTYIAHDRLSTDIQTITAFNQAKLRNRVANNGDKSLDITFAAFREDPQLQP